MDGRASRGWRIISSSHATRSWGITSPWQVSAPESVAVDVGSNKGTRQQPISILVIADGRGLDAGGGVSTLHTAEAEVLFFSSSQVIERVEAIGLPFIIIVFD